MKSLFLALGLVVAVGTAEMATLKGRPTAANSATLKGRPAIADTVTVTLVRWPFT